MLGLKRIKLLGKGALALGFLASGLLALPGNATPREAPGPSAANPPKPAEPVAEPARSRTRSQVLFLGPAGLKIGWQVAGEDGKGRFKAARLTAPARHDFERGATYRLKLTDIPGRAGLRLYPTLEIAPADPATEDFLANSPIPVQFTPEDFDQATDGSGVVTKVVYVRDPEHQEMTAAGVETLVSTRLEPGVNPVQEASRRGTILLIVRLGAIDAEHGEADEPHPAPIRLPATIPAAPTSPDRAPSRKPTAARPRVGVRAESRTVASWGAQFPQELVGRGR